MQNIEEGAVRLIEGGHAFRLDEYGKIDDWALDYDIHNGPRCVVCHEGICEHCEPDWATQKCPRYQETLGGLDYPLIAE